MHGIVTIDDFSIGEHEMNLYMCFIWDIEWVKLSQHQDMLGRWDLEAVVSTIQPLAAAVFFIWCGNIMKSIIPLKGPHR